MRKEALMLHVKIFPVTESFFEYFMTNRIKISALTKKIAKKANFPIGNAIIALKVGHILAISYPIFKIVVPYCRKCHFLMITVYID